MWSRRRRYYKPWPRALPRRSVAARWSRRTHLASFNYLNAKNAILTIFFGATLIWFIYFFLASPHFAIRTVNTSGLESVPREDFDKIVNNYLDSRRALLFRHRNIWLVAKNDLASAIGKKYIFESIAIDRDWPWTLQITVKEKLARLILRTMAKVEITQAGEGVPSTPSIAGSSTDKVSAPAVPSFTLVTSFYYLDVNGIVVSAKDSIDEAELQNLPVVEMSRDSQTPIKPGEVVLERELVGYMFSVYEELQRSRANIKVANLIYDPKITDELKFVTNEGWQGFLSRKLPLPTQVRKLELALEEKIKDKRGQGLQYVDLRVKDRVYFK